MSPPVGVPDGFWHDLAMLKKLRTYWIVFSRMTMHKLQNSHRDDFWAWAYIRVRNPDSGDFKNQTLIWFLLDDALRTQEHVRALTVFRDFQSIIESTWSQKYKDWINESINAAEKIDFTDSANRFS